MLSYILPSSRTTGLDPEPEVSFVPTKKPNSYCRIEEFGSIESADQATQRTWSLAHRGILRQLLRWSSVSSGKLSLRKPSHSQIHYHFRLRSRKDLPIELSSSS